MEKLTQFVFEGENVRTLTREDGSVWFVAKDVAEVLEYKTWHTNLIGHVPDEWKGSKQITTLGGSQEMAIISEPGLYFFLARSDMPKALPFQKWIAGEVIPSIRKTGYYSVSQKRATTPYELIKQQLRQRTEEQIRQWEALEEMDKRVKNQESEISGLKMDLYKRDGYFCVAGYLKRLGQNCDTKTAAKHGRKLTTICKKLGKEIPKIDHPAFGMVNTYPEELLDEYFGVIKVPTNNPRMLPGGLCGQTEFN